jgi:hypothetical protein
VLVSDALRLPAKPVAVEHHSMSSSFLNTGNSCLLFVLGLDCSSYRVLWYMVT